MASFGIVAFEKYFKDTEFLTKIKSDTTLFDFLGKNVGTIGAGETVKVLPSSTYNSKTLVEYNEVKCRVSQISLAKPLKNDLVKIKPQDFDLQNVYSTADLTSYIVEEALPSRDLPKDLNDFLKEITLHYGLDYEMKSKPPAPYVNSIQKDYGEVLGALACVRKNLLPFEVLKDSLIEFPSNGAEPLIDYLIHSKDIHKVSAKAGKTTNTIKAFDIRYLFDYNTAKFATMLGDNGVIQLPFTVMHEFFDFPLIQAGFKNNQLHEKARSSLRKVFGDYDTNGELFIYLEKLVVDFANEHFPTDKVVRALLKEVNYIKFDLPNFAPTGKFELIKQDNFKGSYWRSKNYRLRAADKIGIQI